MCHFLFTTSSVQFLLQITLATQNYNSLEKLKEYSISHVFITVKTERDTGVPEIYRIQVVVKKKKKITN